MPKTAPEIKKKALVKKISKGEKQLAILYREALYRHLKKAKEYSPEKSEEIDQEIKKIRSWLDEFDNRHVGR